MWNTGLDEAQAGLKIVGRNVNNLRYADDTTLMVEREEELKSLLMKVKEESEKADLKFSIQKRKIMASGPIPSWKIDRETKEIMSLQTVTAATKWKDASAPWKKNYDQPRQLIKKQRHYFAKKIHLVKAIIFPVVMYGCESWTIKKVERRRIDAFELWFGEDSWGSPGLQRDQTSPLKGISPEYSLEGLMLKLKPQCFGHLLWRVESIEKTLMLGKTEGQKRRGWQRMRWLDGSLTHWTWVWANSGRWWRTGEPGMLQSMGSQRVGHDWATGQLI